MKRKPEHADAADASAGTAPGAADRGVAGADILREIQQLNLSYLMLAQRLLREHEAEGLFRLGMGQELGRALAELAPAQMVALARSNQLLCRFRLDDCKVLASLTAAEARHPLRGMHAAIVLASEPAGGTR
ncbi:flagellar transcriptional regulator FlhD [Cupriavidus consociatus]|uniref:flagellar transcriptional regulator FlhD n=1 Tax=Cupriavidus consociatus TaxID=2821357 RepID=UPI001AE89162|nr:MULTISPECIES: flagellar transcriptional regulator FlhD [unclassified Cupriavidus]MBP0619540.1 flagellar transcriptional regulator FlhD [Cupriavidus sp. LEh25]MDK2656190.1 flagellar transcriptional regulator FlhD [Cupriavidus sp. LEh21]